MNNQLKKDNTREHIFYFDYLRILAMFSVVFMHVAAVPLRNIPFNGSWQVLNFFTSFAFTAVPIFFMISGYLLINDQYSDNIHKLIYKKIPRLLVPLATWSFIAVVLYSFFDNTISARTIGIGILKAFHAPVAIHFWYLYTLIAIYIISPVLCNGIKMLNRQGKIFVLGIIIVVNIRAMIAALLPEHLKVYTELDIITKMEFFGAHLGTLILGYLIGNYNKKINNILLVCVSIVLYIIICIGTYLSSIKSGSYNQMFQNQSAGFEVFLASTIFIIFKQNFNIPHSSKVIKCMIKLSLSVYLVHNLVISTFYHYGYTFNSMPQAILGTAAVSVFSVIIMWATTKIKPICFILTGERYHH